VSDEYEQLFRLVFARSANPMVLFDDVRRYLDVNPAYEELLGHPRERILGARLVDFLPEEDRAAQLAAWPEFVTAGEQSGEARIERADGEYVTVHYWRQAHVLPHDHLGVLLREGEPVDIDDEPEGPRQPLTSREVDVVRLLALGVDGEEIGRQLHISPETVRTHVRNAMIRRGARTRAHLIAIAMRDGVIEP